MNIYYLAKQKKWSQMAIQNKMNEKFRCENDLTFTQFDILRQMV